MAAQMGKEERKEFWTLEKRIDHLNGEGKILNAEALHTLRRRRNKIAHSLERVQHGELEQAVGLVHRELHAWGLVGPLHSYGLILDDSQLGSAGERLYTIGITAEGWLIFQTTVEEVKEGFVEQAISFFNSTDWPG